MALSDPGDLRVALAPYIDILDRFLAGGIADEDFENVYNTLYMPDETDWPDQVFELLDGVFAEAEALVIDPGSRRLTIGAVGPAELHAHVSHAASRLREQRAIERRSARG